MRRIDEEIEKPHPPSLPPQLVGQTQNHLAPLGRIGAGAPAQPAPQPRATLVERLNQFPIDSATKHRQAYDRPPCLVRLSAMSPRASRIHTGSVRCFLRWAIVGGLLGAMVGGGIYGWRARDRWPPWPGGQAAWYDQQAAAGFPSAREYQIPGFLTPAAAPLGVMRALDRVSVHFFLDGGTFAFQPFEEGPMPLGGRTLESIAADFSQRTGVAFAPVLVTEFPATYFSPGGVRGPTPTQGDGFIAILSANGASPRREVTLLFCDEDGYSETSVDNRGGVFAAAMGKVGRTLPLPSRAGVTPEVVAEDLRRSAGESARVMYRVNAHRHVGGSSHSYAEISLTADSRGIAAASDRLRTLVIYEIVGDTATIALASALPAAPIFGGIAMFLRVRGRKRRVKAGHCVDCDYDLRHQSTRCPECGREMAFV